MAENYKKELSNTNKQLKSLATERKKYISLYAKGMLSEKDLESFIDGIDGKINYFTKEIKNLENIIENNKLIEEKENNLKSIPISALTANAIKGDKEKFLDLGMDYYLSKPISVAKLKELFNIYLLSGETTVKEKAVEEKIIEEKKDKSIELEITTFNKNDAINQLGLDEEIVDMLLDNFFLTLDNDLKKIQDAIDSKNSENIVQAAHYLKGSCANLAMNDAVKILQEIETKAKEGEVNFDLKKLNSFFNQIR